MPDRCERKENDDRSKGLETFGGQAGRLGQDVGETGADIVGLGGGLLGELSDALGGLASGLAGNSSGKRRTRVHPWELPREPETTDNHESPRSSGRPGDTDEYDEDYDRIH